MGMIGATIDPANLITGGRLPQLPLALNDCVERASQTLETQRFKCRNHEKSGQFNLVRADTS